MWENRRFHHGRPCMPRFIDDPVPFAVRGAARDSQCRRGVSFVPAAARIAISTCAAVLALAAPPAAVLAQGAAKDAARATAFAPAEQIESAAAQQYRN
jgi:hypothetical protein